MFRHLFTSLLVIFSLLRLSAAGPWPPGPTDLTRAEEAMARARAESKHILVLFKASWCAPCLWMERTTMTDPRVLELIETYYIPVLADIDEPEGYVLFFDHEITTLPTLIVMDDQGRVLDRREESLGADTMADWLTDQARDLPSRPTAIVRTRTLSMETPDVPPSKTGGPENKLSPPPVTGFSVQVGVYTLYPNVLAKAQELQALGSQPVHVEESEIDGVVLYKLLSGHFPDRSGAEDWRHRLAEARTPGYIRDLARP